jgi:hypothetical protein
MVLSQKQIGGKVWWEDEVKPPVSLASKGILLENYLPAQ